MQPDNFKGQIYQDKNFIGLMKQVKLLVQIMIFSIGKLLFHHVIKMAKTKIAKVSIRYSKQSDGFIKVYINDGLKPPTSYANIVEFDINYPVMTS